MALTTNRLPAPRPPSVAASKRKWPVATDGKAVQLREKQPQREASAQEGGWWSTPRPGRFTPEKKTLYPLYKRLGGCRGRSGRVRKISSPSSFEPRTVQLIATRYTDCANSQTSTRTRRYKNKKKPNQKKVAKTGRKRRKEKMQ